MKIKGKISILINRDFTTIEVHDEEAFITFAEIRLTPEQLSSALSRIAYTDCSIELRGIDIIGKKHENKTVEFAINPKLRGSEHREKLISIIQPILDNEGEGWIADGYFGSQNSFFEKDNCQYARCTVRRWV